ncbi:MAG TPA: ABC transporter substrate-binding protein, partial [Methanocorpusculum sp.]|nr:ABC transporter substrate-binding protein [Methanocorpusculum sp.]
GLISSKLNSTTDDETKELIFDFESYNAAKEQIKSGKFVTPNPVKKIRIGYLSSDHDAALFVLVKEWKYFKEHYNSYIKPTNELKPKLGGGELYINGEKIADVEFVEGTAGPNLMILMQQNAIQYAIAGAPPYLSAIDKSSGNVVLKILCPIQTEGSGLIASINSPASDWDSFVNWIKERSASGKNVVIAVPQLGSIQDMQIKAALKSAGINYDIKKSA